MLNCDLDLSILFSRNTQSFPLCSHYISSISHRHSCWHKKGDSTEASPVYALHAHTSNGCPNRGSRSGQCRAVARMRMHIPSAAASCIHAVHPLPDVRPLHIASSPRGGQSKGPRSNHCGSPDRSTSPRGHQQPSPRSPSTKQPLLSARSLEPKQQSGGCSSRTQHHHAHSPRGRS